MAQGIRDAPVIRTGFACNNRCRFCDQSRLRAAEVDAPDAADVQARAIDAARAAAEGRGLVVIAGGEATLRRELPSWVQAAKRHGARKVVVQTNGRVLAYRKRAEQVVSSGVDVVAVALHGHVAPLHDWVTQVDGSFDQATAGIRHVHRAGAAVVVNTVVCRSNYRHLAAIVALAKRLGAVSWRAVWPRLEGDAVRFAPSLVPTEDLALPFVRHALEAAQTLGLRASFDDAGLDAAGTPTASTADAAPASPG